MTLQSHIVELERRHEALEKEITQEQLHRAMDARKIHELKRKKLLIKDEISKLKQTETLH